MQEKDASEAQEEDGRDLGQRKVCPWGMLIRRSWGMGRLCVRALACVKQSLSLSLSLSLSRSLAFSCSCCALSHNAQTRTPTPTPTPNITPTLVQRAGMPRFLRKPSSGEQGTRQGRITSPFPNHLHTKKHTPPARTCTHTSAHIRICVWSQGTRQGSITTS